MGRFVVGHKSQVALVTALVVLVGAWVVAAPHGESEGRLSDFLRFSAPAGDRPATTDTVIDGVRAAVLPNGRLVTPAGTEVNVQAPKPFGLALSPNGEILATLNSGAGPFSLTLITQIRSHTPVVKRIDVNASFMGVTFSPDSRRVYLSGGENGNIWIGDAIAGRIIGSVNLNGPTHVLDRPLDVIATPQLHFKGAFPGNMAITGDGRYLYVVDQGGFQVHVIDVVQDSDRGRCAGADHRTGQLCRRRRACRGRALSLRDRALSRRPYAVRDPRGRVPVPPTSDRRIRPATATSITRSAIRAWGIRTRRATIA